MKKDNNDLSQYVDTYVTPAGVFVVEFKATIPDVECDIKIADHIYAEVKKSVQTNKSLKKRALIDIDRYHREDCKGMFGISYPSLGARKSQAKIMKEFSVEKMAFYKKKVNHLIKSIVIASTLYGDCKVRVFGSKKEAMAWLLKD